MDGIVMDGELNDVKAEELVRDFKAAKPKIPIVVIKGPVGDDCEGADFQLESFHPAKLLETLRGLKPKESAEIEKHDEAINQEKVR